MITYLNWTDTERQRPDSQLQHLETPICNADNDVIPVVFQTLHRRKVVKGSGRLRTSKMNHIGVFLVEENEFYDTIEEGSYSPDDVKRWAHMPDFA